MKSKSNNFLNPNDDLLSDHLSRMVDRSRMDLFRSINTAIVTLFWETGIVLNEYALKNNRSAFDKMFIPKIAEQLHAKYGAWFNERNLKAMMEFARQFPDMSCVAKIASFLSWKYIVPLLQTDNLDATLFYSRLAIEQGLSVINLRKQMAGKRFEKQQAAKRNYRIHKEKPGSAKIGTKVFSQIMKLSVEQEFNGNSIMKNVFKQPLLRSYRRLTKPSEDSSIRMATPRNAPTDPAALFTVLSAQVENYRYQQNRSINSNLNVCFRKIGNLINQQIRLKKDDNHYYKSVIRNASVQLKKKYGKNISEKQLREMTMFAEQFNGLNIGARIISLISWAHILVLLPLQKQDKIFFYSKLAATHGLSATALQKEIANYVYEKNIGAKETIHTKKGPLPGEIEHTTINITGAGKNGHTTDTVSIIYNDRNKNGTFINIFRNPYLSLLA